MTFPPDSPQRIAYTLAVELLVAGIALAFLACLGGCYGSPIDTRAIDADKVTIVHSTPWTTMTIQAEGWHSTVKAQSVETSSETK